MSHPQTRDTINIKDATILVNDACAGNQYLMRLQAPLTAAEAKPGSFIYLACDASLSMRRPMSIMRTDPTAGWIEILYKAHGQGTKLLAQRQPGETINLLGPIGTPFKLQDYRKQTLLIGGGVGIPPMIFLAEHIKNTARHIRPFVIMGSEVPFPFTPKPSQLLIAGMPEGTIACMPLLEDWDIPCRLTSLQGYAGCYEGYVTDLARHWLDSLDEAARAELEVFCCGPTAMLIAVAKLAKQYDLPCQVSMEEYMACAVGGCAGCVVRVETDRGPVMQRVCVDGPVFDANAVFP